MRNGREGGMGVGTDRNVTGSEEVEGDQPEVDVVHVAPQRRRVFGGYEAEGGRLQLQERIRHV